MLADHLVAHRGYPARLPENTLPSIEAAVQAGARYIEVDVQLSRDGEVILFHDRDLHRLCGQAGRRRLTLQGQYPSRICTKS